MEPIVNLPHDCCRLHHPWHAQRPPRALLSHPRYSSRAPRSRSRSTELPRSSATTSSTMRMATVRSSSSAYPLARACCPRMQRGRAYVVDARRARPHRASATVTVVPPATCARLDRSNGILEIEFGAVRNTLASAYCALSELRHRGPLCSRSRRHSHCTRDNSATTSPVRPAVDTVSATRITHLASGAELGFNVSGSASDGEQHMSFYVDWCAGPRVTAIRRRRSASARNPPHPASRVMQGRRAGPQRADLRHRARCARQRGRRGSRVHRLHELAAAARAPPDHDSGHRGCGQRAPCRRMRRVGALCS